MSDMPPPFQPGPQPGPPPGQYQGPPPYWYGYGPAPIEHPQGTTILVLGILSLVVCGVLGPFAWKMGNTANAEMAARPDLAYSNKGQINAGRICGMVGTGLLAFQVLMFTVVILIMIAGAASGN